LRRDRLIRKKRGGGGAETGNAGEVHSSGNMWAITKGKLDSFLRGESTVTETSEIRKTSGALCGIMEKLSIALVQEFQSPANLFRHCKAGKEPAKRGGYGFGDEKVNL